MGSTVVAFGTGTNAVCPAGFGALSPQTPSVPGKGQQLTGGSIHSLCKGISRWLFVQCSWVRSACLPVNVGVGVGCAWR